jgi:hypothetical protein
VGLSTHRPKSCRILFTHPDEAHHRKTKGRPEQSLEIELEASASAPVPEPSVTAEISIAGRRRDARRGTHLLLVPQLCRIEVDGVLDTRAVDGHDDTSVVGIVRRGYAGLYERLGLVEPIERLDRDSQRGVGEEPDAD